MQCLVCAEGSGEELSELGLGSGVLHPAASLGTAAFPAPIPAPAPPSLPPPSHQARLQTRRSKTPPWPAPHSLPKREAVPWLLCCCAIVLLGQAVFGSVATQDLWLITAVGGGDTKQGVMEGHSPQLASFSFLHVHTHTLRVLILHKFVIISSSLN